MRSILDKAMAALLEGKKELADQLFHNFVLERARQVNESFVETGDVDVDGIVEGKTYKRNEDEAHDKKEKDKERKDAAKQKRSEVKEGEEQPEAGEEGEEGEAVEEGKTFKRGKDEDAEDKKAKDKDRKEQRQNKREVSESEVEEAIRVMGNASGTMRRPPKVDNQGNDRSAERNEIAAQAKSARAAGKDLPNGREVRNGDDRVMKYNSNAVQKPTDEEAEVDEATRAYIDKGGDLKRPQTQDDRNRLANTVKIARKTDNTGNNGEHWVRHDDMPHGYGRDQAFSRSTVKKNDPEFDRPHLRGKGVHEGKLEMTQGDDGVLHVVHTPEHDGGMDVVPDMAEPMANTPATPAIPPVGGMAEPVGNPADDLGAPDLGMDDMDTGMDMGSPEVSNDPMPGVEDLSDESAFESLKESLADELMKIIIKTKDGDFATGGSAGGEKHSPVPNVAPKDRMEKGDPVKIKSDEHNGFDREPSPSTKSAPKAVNTKASATDGRKEVPSPKS